MQGHRLPATLQVTGLNPGRPACKIDLINIEKTSSGFLTLEKVHSLYKEKRTFELDKKHYIYAKQ